MRSLSLLSRWSSTTRIVWMQLVSIPIVVNGQLSLLVEEDCPCFADECPSGYQCFCEKGGNECKDKCYHAVCPEGYWKCCHDCAASTCAVRESELILSFRGVLECLPCTTGDYCAGCDRREECPMERRQDQYGAELWVPYISNPVASKPSHCMRCPSSYEPDLEHGKCIYPFRAACSLPSMLKCLDKCPAFFDYSGGEPLSDCDKYQCMIDCAAEDENKNCLDPFKQLCEHVNLPIPIVDDAFSATPAPLSDNSGIARPPVFHGGCDLKCNRSITKHALNYSLLAFIAIFMVLECGLV